MGEALSLEGHSWIVSGKAAPATLKLQGTGLGRPHRPRRQMAQEVSLKIVGKERVAHIAVKGNRRIEKDAILGVMQTREGETRQPGPPPGRLEGHL